MVLDCLDIQTDAVSSVYVCTEFGNFAGRLLVSNFFSCTLVVYGTYSVRSSGRLASVDGSRLLLIAVARCGVTTSLWPQNVQSACLCFRRALQRPMQGTWGTLAILTRCEIDVNESRPREDSLLSLMDWLSFRIRGAIISFCSASHLAHLRICNLVRVICLCAVALFLFNAPGCWFLLFSVVCTTYARYTLYPDAVCGSWCLAPVDRP